MLPQRHGRRALLRRVRGRLAGRGARGGTALLMVVAVGLAAPLGAAAKDGDTWTPSNWTGEVAGPPVPGEGLPPAAVPAIAQPLPEGMYDVSPTYEGQDQCDPQAKPGTQRLADLIKATYGDSQTVWIPRACDVGGQSEHKEGRALDWMTSVRDPQQRANAETFLAWLLGPDQFGVAYGNAMRLGVMYIGWNDRIWRGYDIKRGWTELKGCFATPSQGSDTTCHRNHIHISLTWDGASGRTSFWDGTPMDGPYCPKASSSASVASSGRAADMVPVGPVKVLGTRKAVGVPERCRLQQDRYSGDRHRIYAKVTGQGGVPADGVAAVAIQVTGMGANAPTKIRVWGPGESKSEVVVKQPMNMDAVGSAIVPVASDGTIALAVSAGATDISVDVVGYYPPGDTPNRTDATPGDAMPMGDEPPTPAAPPAPPVETPVPSAPAFQPDLPDEFISIGAEVGYESSAQGPLQPGEERVVGLAAVPPEATSALVLITTREATKRGKVRIGTPDKDPSTTFKFPKRGVRSAVMVVPVVGSQVKFVTSKKAAVQLRVEVLGYALNGKPIKARSSPTTRISKGKLEANAPLVLGPVTGIGGLPKKLKKITGVILRVRTKDKAAEPGSLKVFGLDGPAPQTRSAPIVPGSAYTSLVVAELGTDGKIVLQSSVPTKVRVKIVGWVRRSK